MFIKKIQIFIFIIYCFYIFYALYNEYLNTKICINENENENENTSKKYNFDFNNNNLIEKKNIAHNVINNYIKINVNDLKIANLLINNLKGNFIFSILMISSYNSHTLKNDIIEPIKNIIIIVECLHNIFLLINKNIDTEKYNLTFMPIMILQYLSLIYSNVSEYMKYLKENNETYIDYVTNIFNSLLNNFCIEQMNQKLNTNDKKYMHDLFNFSYTLLWIVLNIKKKYEENKNDFEKIKKMSKSFSNLYQMQFNVNDNNANDSHLFFKHKKNIKKILKNLNLYNEETKHIIHFYYEKFNMQIKNNKSMNNNSNLSCISYFINF
jgi:hypothetical protein